MLRLRRTASSGRDSGVGANHGGAGRGGVGQGGAAPGSQEHPAPQEYLEVLEFPASPEPLVEGVSPGALEHLEAQGTPAVLEPAKIE